MFQYETFLRFYKAISKEYKGALISPGSNLYYLTGINPSSVHERLFLFIVPTEGEPVIIAPKLYQDEVSASWVTKTMLWDDGDNPYKMLEMVLSAISKHEGCRLLVEDSMPVSVFFNIQS
ncbi:aminopeptidase P family N-terminal domain-containing protein, partial [Desulfofundulus sp.]|uniref:aminopeptidase P family N-terminal domain-containing protein n=1 Tax=Desulfofundulus sp. TaxID=2282750 RepID=UPI003C72BC69